jgi:flagellar hook-associated protein 3 FlgL
MTSDNALRNIQTARARINRLNEQISSQKNINRPSDDPISARNILDLENVVKQSDQYSSNIVKATTWLKLTDTALSGLSDIVKNIRKIAGTAIGGTDNSAEGQVIRNNAVSQLKEMQKQLVDMANTQSGDQSLFGGFKNDVKSFTLPAAYNGDSSSININITSNSSITMNLAGDVVLKGTTQNGTLPGPYGNVDILTTLDNLITAINTPNNAAAIQALATTFDGSVNQLNNAKSDVASKLMRLENTKNLLTRDKNTILGIISDRQNVDLAKAATELSQEETAFQATLSATAKISKISLLDYI